MIIYTKEHFKDIYAYFAPKLHAILSRKLNPTNTREIITTLTNHTSYASLCATLKKHPVELNSTNVTKLRSLLALKHKITITDWHEAALTALSDSSPLALMYAPNGNFPEFNTGTRDLYWEVKSNQVSKLKEQAISFTKLLSNTKNNTKKSKNTYPEMEFDFEGEDNTEEEITFGVHCYIAEYMDTGFNWKTNVTHAGLCAYDGLMLCKKEVQAWINANPDTFDDMMLYATSETMSDRYIIDVRASSIYHGSKKINELSDNQELSTLLLKHFSNDLSLIYWSAIEPNLEMSGYDVLEETYVGTQILYIGILDKGIFTPIAKANALTMSFSADTNMHTLFAMCDAHSDTLNKLFKNTYAYILEENMSWDEFILSNVDKGLRRIVHGRDIESIYENEPFELLVDTLFSEGNPNAITIIDDGISAYPAFCNKDDVSPVGGMIEINQACLQFTTVCGARPVEGYDNPIFLDDFDLIEESEKIPLTEDQLKRKNEQLAYAEKLTDKLSNSKTKVLKYDPYARPSS